MLKYKRAIEPDALASKYKFNEGTFALNKALK
jgi:hypothetical protein